ncbi:MAG: NAD(P)H-dependent flavin oxidoreductase, partial [Thermomicrobiales bacterium]
MSGTATLTPTRSPLHTLLCQRLGITHPIVKAPMAGGTDTIELVAAVSNAGGVGIFGALMMPPEELRTAIRAIRTHTDRPFGVNVIAHRAEVSQAETAALNVVLDELRRELGLPPGPAAVQMPPSWLAEQIQVICEERVPVLNPMGDPAGLIEPAHEAGVTVMGFVTTVGEAEEAVAAGVDVIVAQGAEAGGLRATYRLDRRHEAALVGTMALVPQVVDAVPSSIPIVAAGGIMDGRGVVA